MSDRTTYYLDDPEGGIGKTNDAKLAERFSRIGFRVTAHTHGGEN